MDRDLEVALQGIADAESEWPGGGSVDFDSEYRELVRICEALPENAEGADKTWVLRSMRQVEELHRRVRRG